MLRNGPHVLGKSTFGLMSHSGLLYSVQCTLYSMSHSNYCTVCGILNCVAFGTVSHSEFCRIWYYVAFGVMLFGIMLFGIMSHSGLCRLAYCCIRHYVAFRLTYVVWDCVIQCNVIRPTVGVSSWSVNLACQSSSLPIF